MLTKIINLKYFIFLFIVPTLESAKDVFFDDFIQINQQPRTLQLDIPVHFKYQCSVPSVIIIELSITTDFSIDNVIFDKRIICNYVNITQMAIIKLYVPRYVAFSPGHFNKYSIYVLYSKLKLWMHPVNKYHEFNLAKIRESIKIQVLPPYERPKRPLNFCISWLINILKEYENYSPICSLDQEKINVLSEPMALTGSSVGFITMFKPYQNHILERQRIKNINQPRFSFSMMIYVIEYCQPKFKYCSLMHHYTWDDDILTPLVLITHTGQIHLELFLLGELAKAYLSSFMIPKNKWIQIIITCRSSYKWEMYLRFDKDNYSTTKIILYQSDVVPFDDTKGVFAFGGSDVRTSFHGFISNVIYYRNRAVDPSKIEFDINSNMKILIDDQLCLYEKQEIDKYIEKTQSAIKSIIIKTSCQSFIYNLLLWNNNLKETPKKCTSEQHVKFIRKEIRKKILEQNFSYTILSNLLYEKSLDLLANDGYKYISEINVLLNHASCLRNSDAMFLRSIFLNHGVGRTSNSSLAYYMLMKCAIMKNIYCLMSLAYKHTYGLDNITMNINIAYGYYMDVSYTTKKDLDEHRNEDVYTELIRLNDERSLDRQMDENDNLYFWLKHQATQGIVSAQHNLAQMLYWGSKGLKRNISTASNYYKAAAESKNPTALYDYAIILLKGHGVQRDVVKSMELLEEAAQHNHPNAINTIGWYALTQERNMEKAAEYLERSFQLGNADAGHNLAYMLITGKYPGFGKDKVRAWRYISRAATRGNYESAILVAQYNMKGHPSVLQSSYVAMEWGRYMSEQNPSVGKLLMKGIKNFRTKNWYTSLIYYLMAAEIGVEVANFNVAYLCDENYDYLSSVMQLDCVWRHYNQSIQRSTKRENPYAWMRMADLLYNRNDVKSASFTYCDAALAGDPQGLFNLALTVQNGLPVPDLVWQKLGIAFNLSRNHHELIVNLYQRCLEMSNDDAYLPCLISLTGVKFKYFLHNSYIPKMFFFTAALFVFLYIVYHFKFKPIQRDVIHDHDT